jgi:ubiquinone/menaquinone biosynthesis C-methylase UbiE
MKNIIPAAVRPIVRRTYNVVLDQIDLLTGRRDSLTPPRNLMFVGGDFKAVGREFLGHFVEIGGLQPDDRVLDIGSGIGRMAVPLTGYLSPQGQYRGIEIVEDGVRWCQNRITSRFPNFRFVRADVYNKLYHPAGRYQGAAYRFPFEDGSFDFVFLTSVFTHMFPADVTNYVSEASRVLRQGGRCFATFFLVTPESRSLIEQVKSTQPFQHQG